MPITERNPEPAAAGSPLGCLLAGAVSVTAAALIMYLFNDDYYRSRLNADPQGADQEFDLARVDAFMTATSGFTCTVVIAFLTGFALRQRTTGQFRPLLLAGATGLGLAALDALIGWSLSHRQRAAVRLLGDGSGAVPARDIALDPDFVLLLGALITLVVLAALAGAGLGAGTPRLTPLVTGVPVVWLLAAAVSVLNPGSAGQYAANVVLPPTAVGPAVVASALGSSPGARGDARWYAVAMLTGATAWALVLVARGIRIGRR